MMNKFEKIFKGIQKDLKNLLNLKNEKSKKFLMILIFGFILFLTVNKLAYSYRIYQNFNHIISIPIISFDNNDMSYAVFITGVLLLVGYEKFSNKKKFRKGIEHGSARWVA